MDLEKFKEKIINDINSSGLPLGVIYYVFKDIYRIIENEYTNYLMQNHEIKLNEDIKAEEEM